MFCGEAACVDMDDPMGFILGRGGGKGKRGRGLGRGNHGSGLELRNVTVPKTYGGLETIEVKATATTGKTRRGWLRLTDVP